MTIKTEIIEYSVTDAAIATMADVYLKLKIDGVDDRPGLVAVHDARMIVKGKRIEVEKKRVELKADALDWGRKVDAEAKRITGLLAPIEEHLETEEKRVTDDKARLKAEAERRDAERLQSRLDALAAYGATIPLELLRVLTEEGYQVELEKAAAVWEAEQARLAEIEAVRVAAEEAERVRLAEEAVAREAERAENARVAAELARQQEEIRQAQAKIDSDRKAIEDAKRAEEQAKELEARLEKARAATAERLEREKAEAAARAVREAEERARKEAEDKAAAEEAARVEAARQEALRPDKEKLLTYSSALLAVAHPELATEAAREAMQNAAKALLSLCMSITRKAATL